MRRSAAVCRRPGGWLFAGHGRLQLVDLRALRGIESGVESGDEISPHYDSDDRQARLRIGPDCDAARRALLAGLRASTR